MKHLELFCDLETYCETDIKDGASKYAEDAEVLLFPYALEDEEPTVLDFTEEGFSFRQTELYDMLKDDNVKTVWHNGSMFDRIVLQFAEGIDLPYDRVHDTMVQAYTHGLPGKLETLCTVFKLDEELAKMKEGKRLIQLFCKPRPKNHKLRRATRETHPEDWELFTQYAFRDIVSMRELRRKMPMWNLNNDKERRLWYLDQKINDRGFAVDLELAQTIIEAVENAKEELNERLYQLTDGAVEKATQTKALVEYLIDHQGYYIENLQADTIDQALKNPQTPDLVKRVLNIRRVVSGTAVRKYDTLLRSVNSDGRLRGCLQFAGAGRTARWAGRVFQPQNLPRPVLPQNEIEQGIEAVKGGSCGDIENVVALATSAVRGSIIAGSGRKLVVSDLSNIEGRMAAWLADEQWKLKAFREFDAGTGHDLYVVAYAASFDVDPQEVLDNKKNGDGTMRQIGKVQELMLQYEGGVGAFITGAATYGIDLDDLAKRAYRLIPHGTLNEARKAWGWAVTQKRTQGLQERVYVVCDSLKRMWRAKHPNIVGFWNELKEAAIGAVQHPGTVFTTGKIKFYRKGSWLRMQLPSGRYVVYAQPSIKDGKLSYYSVNSITKKWAKESTYGGKLFENACQAASRDVMAENMPAIEASGYPIILSVHDELITEPLDSDKYTPQGLSSLLATNPEWAEGLPLAAGGFEAYRYKKD